MTTVVRAVALGGLVAGLASPAQPQVQGRLSKLPEWFVSSRVHLNAGMLADGLEAETLAQGLADAGVSVFTVHVKRKSADPLWPSAVPRDSLGRAAVSGQRDVISPLVRAMHRRGIRVIAYYFPSTDQTIARLLPAVGCRDERGRPLYYKEDRGFEDVRWLDITAPAYRDIIRDRLIELAGMGVDGFNFDETHLPPGGCWGTAVEQAYRAATGKSAPTSTSHTNAQYVEFLRFHQTRIEDAFAYLQDAVRRRHPNVVFVISSHALARPLDPRGSSRLARMVDVQKNEFSMPLRNGSDLPNIFRREFGLPQPDRDAMQAFGLAWIRDAGDGRPARLWHPDASDQSRITTTAWATVAYGSTFAMSAPRASLLKSPGTPLNDWQRELFRFGKVIAPMVSQPPLRWGAVHFSEAARNATGAARSTAWRAVVMPTIGAFTAFVREGLPVGLLGDEQLDDAHLADYRVLYLPTPVTLNPNQGNAVARFRQRGGIVVEGPVAAVRTQREFNELVDAARGKLRTLSAMAPVSLTSETAGRVHVVPYSAGLSGTMLLAVLNHFSGERELDGTQARSTATLAVDASIILRPPRSVLRAYDLLTRAPIAVRKVGNATVLDVSKVSTVRFVVVELDRR